ncbi:oleate hydratase [Aspergillus clavatus NRRL 1]|uniref:Streptococcal 67 kDa myosin-cross-reactive antigen like family protein n=1 Tax=Aspergillus clavatus (strain ATCC 1007 / CBS 513.65 / DSM 816 / NCTC 3887 / NRRL 1 / QM 1276 / 107) TaxID=344612 RepID=A1CLU6_ASPCL|nr:streptococcal 67 kDa myosin-cross-reactive antigen like family protein [Aspergillus clavatus NRRL 1]EAW09075.1 streptococcal 67 kDa myosin-cross-reactive antigen like family protein [Aspergillus clavatus NRRL 1]
MRTFCGRPDNRQEKRDPEQTEAWILGSGISALASAFYLVVNAKVPPGQVHILDSHTSLLDAIHQRGDPVRGYDQFAGCLPVPVGPPLEKLLASIPSTWGQGKSVLDEIRSQSAIRTALSHSHRASFMVQRGGKLRTVPTASLNLSFRHRIQLLCFLLKSERQLRRNAIKDYFDASFFHSIFWAVWSAQFCFQPWHSALELKRSLLQYFHDHRSLSLLTCLDITGYYQHESIFLPIFLYLRSIHVDYQFNTKVENIVTHSDDRQQQSITRLEIVQNGNHLAKNLGRDDIILMTVGSSVSESIAGTNDHPPVWNLLELGEPLDENWSLWLALRNSDARFGDPYQFCTRESESLLESFTITTGDAIFFQHLWSLSDHQSEAGIFISLQESQWRMNICVPMQPVFSDQPPSVRVIWGFATLPARKGDYVKKPMLQCSGQEILAEMLWQLNIRRPPDRQSTVTIPRLMPRMSASLLARAQNDRPEILPRGTCDIGLVGQFVEIPHISSVDVSYSVRSAEIAVSRLMGVEVGQGLSCRLSFSALFLGSFLCF